MQTITRLDPKFIALHCQEVGGKNYEQSMRHVEDFVRYVSYYFFFSSSIMTQIDKILLNVEM